MVRVSQLLLALPARAEGAMAEVAELQVEAGRGIVGDLGYGDGAGEFVLFSREVFDALRRELSALHAEAWCLRAQVLTEGANLAEWVGRRFRVGQVEVEGVRLRAPEPWMERAIALGAVAWLEGRAGLIVRPVSSGVIRRDATKLKLPTSGQRLAAEWPEHEWE
jgi:MOSC domain-containing protein YiiM